MPAKSLTGTRRVIASLLLGGLLTVPHAVPALAGMEFSPSSVGRGVLLVASPSLDDPNFRQAVVLVVEHGPEGTLGLILNRSTRVLLSAVCGWTGRAKPPSSAVPAQGVSGRRTIGFRRGLCGGDHWGPGTHHYARQTDRNLPGFRRSRRLGSGTAGI